MILKTSFVYIYFFYQIMLLFIYFMHLWLFYLYDRYKLWSKKCYQHPFGTTTIS